MVKTTEDWLTLEDGTKLYTKRWEPETQPVAILVFLHGFSDHCNAYYNFFPTLATNHSIATHSFDQRGWGRSVHHQRDKGLTGPTHTVLADIAAFITHTASLPSCGDIPFFLMGHSMGGGEALLYALLPPPNAKSHPPIHGLLLESPFIAADPSSQPSAFLVFACKLAAKLLPNHQMVPKLDSAYMSHSAQVRKDWKDDPLCHDTGTFEGMTGMFQRAADLDALGHGKVVDGLSNEIGCPVWIGHGSGDKVTSFPASERVFGELVVKETGDKTFKNFEGAYHKLHAEPDGVGEEFAKEVGEWIVKHASQGDHTKPKL